MEKVEYKKEDIQLLTALLNMVTVKGFDNINRMTQVASILDRGIIKEIPEKEKPQQSGKEAKNEAD